MQSDWSVRANRVTSRLRAVGGHLTVEGDTLRFEPHRVDRALRGTPLIVALADIDEVSVAPRRPFSNIAGLRRQLVVQVGGQRTYFVVNRVEQVAEDLRRASRP